MKTLKRITLFIILKVAEIILTGSVLFLIIMFADSIAGYITDSIKEIVCLSFLGFGVLFLLGIWFKANWDYVKRKIK